MGSELNKKKAAIIAIGDEILIGQIPDTNSNWLAIEFHAMGIDLLKVVVVGDDIGEILSTIKSLEKEVRLIVLTGGLGPTRDDRTKEAIADYLGYPLEFNQSVFDWIAEHKEKQGSRPNDLHKKQAILPRNMKFFRNTKGTAPGMLGEKNGTLIVSVPGVPYEMKSLMKEQIFPYLFDKIDLKVIRTKTLLTIGLPESEIAERLTEFEKQLPKGLSLAYLPGHTRIRLRLTAASNDGDAAEKLLQDYVQKMYSVLGLTIFGEGDDTLEEVVGKILRQKGLTISTAESCTGGFISHLITSVSGSSDYYRGSVIAYDNSVKVAELNVPEEVLESDGAVSERTVRYMLSGICAKMSTDLGIAISGIAGPGGGSKEKPVGTVWVAVGYSDVQVVKRLNLNLDRKLNIEKSGLLALNMLRLFLLSN